VQEENHNNIQENPTIYCGDELNIDMSSASKGKPRSSEQVGCHIAYFKNYKIISNYIFHLTFHCWFEAEF